MGWLFLTVAGLCEIGWPLGLKLSQSTPHRAAWLAYAALAMAVSGVCLWLAQKTIPLGTAYAVWSGIGAAGTFAAGVLLFGDPATAARVVSVSLIVIGIVGLKVFPA